MGKEKLPNDATFEQRFDKFAAIVLKLHENNISLVGMHDGNPVVGDESCDFDLVQSITVWENEDVDEIVKKIVDAREIIRLQSMN